MLNFEERKRDHINISLSPQSQSALSTGLDQVQLVHEALPEIDFSDVTIKTSSVFAKQGITLSSPMYVAAMTLGHSESSQINQVIARVCEQRGWLMGVGSQRRQLDDEAAAQECVDLRRQFPKLVVMGNIGLSQLIQTPLEKIERLVDSLQAQAMVVHTNPLQECIQPEGTPQFRGGLKAIQNLCQRLKVPVIVKETGCGFSAKTLDKLNHSGVSAVDLSGRGGTHWGRVEAARLPVQDLRQAAGQSFADWGLSTVQSLMAANESLRTYQVWASGGVRSGLDAAKLLAMGAGMVGFAQPILQEAIKGEEALNFYMESLEYELKTALFCMGIEKMEDLKKDGLWKWI